jgi:nucleoside-diphosphate-sugar epimerase
MAGRLNERHLHVFGPGYSARAVAGLVQAEGGRVSATCRDPARARILSDARLLVVDPGTMPSGITDLLISAPPGPEGCPAHAVLAAQLPKLRWIGYFSSTGIYGDCRGAWIDETAPDNPQGADAENRVLAEKQWRETSRAHDVALDILRIAGIYGPDGRNVLSQLRAGTARAIIKPGQFFNRIHRDDIAGATLAAMCAPNGERMTNLADSHPCAASDVLIGVAGMLGVPSPPEVMLADARLPPGAARFYAQSRKLRNDRLLALPGFTLRYPTWREGYAQIIAAGG